MKKSIIAFTLAALLSLSFAGCMEEAGKDVSQTASRLESGMEEAGSRLESGMDDAGSRVGSAVDSMMEGSSSQQKASPTPQAR